MTASRTRLQIEADRRAAEGIRILGKEIRHLREDAGLSKTVVARLAGVHRTHLGLVEDGRRDPSASVRERIAAALGAESSIRLFPVGGPPIRDRFQARMLEAFVRELPPHWRRAVEVAVYRPVRGVIDGVFADTLARRVVAVECHSELRRLEHQVRWALAKADALPSSRAWPFGIADDGGPVTISSILLLRSTRATRRLAREFAATLASAFPAEPAVLRRAIFDPTMPWPGSGIVWVGLDGTKATILAGKPRGV